MQLTIILVKSFIIFIEMRSEDRIVELLAESLKRQDQHTEILQQHTNILTEHTSILTEHTSILTEHTGILNQVSTVLVRLVRAVENLTHAFDTKFTQVQDHETRISRLENRFLK